MAMVVAFYKVDGGRLCGWAATPPKRRRFLGSTMAAGRDLPHDLAHFVVEGTLGLECGFWGLLAKGASFKSVPGRRRTEPGRAVIREHHAGLANAEGLVNANLRAWRAGGATPVRAALDAMLERWRALPVGEELRLDWPFGAASGPRSSTWKAAPEGTRNLRRAGGAVEARRHGSAQGGSRARAPLLDRRDRDRARRMTPSRRFRLAVGGVLLGALVLGIACRRAGRPQRESASLGSLDRPAPLVAAERVELQVAIHDLVEPAGEGTAIRVCRSLASRPVALRVVAGQHLGAVLETLAAQVGTHLALPGAGSDSDSLPTIPCAGVGDYLVIGRRSR